MKSFINCMVLKDGDCLLEHFSRKSSWKYAPYEIGSGKPMKAEIVSFPELSRDFRKKKNWYRFFFDEPNGCTYQVNFKKDTMWKKKGRNTFVAPHSYSGNTYIKWKQEDGKWVIEEIGETVV